MSALNISQSNTYINWSTGESSDNITVSPLSNNEFWVEVSDGVTICRDSVQINVNPLPTVEISSVNQICMGDSALINLNFSGYPPYVVNFNGNNETFLANFENFYVHPVNTTAYSINSVSDLNCQNDTNKTHIINVNPLPNPLINPSNYELYPNENIELSVGNYQNYSWYNYNDSLLSENEVLIVDSTINVYVIVEDINNCIGISNNADILFIPRVILHIPNAFTPNGDEHNELFVIKANQIQSFSMIIVNRWGEEMFKTSSLDKHWDGKFNQKPVQQGAYTYIINIIGDDKRAFTKTGIVNVLYLSLIHI